MEAAGSSHPFRRLVCLFLLLCGAIYWEQFFGFSTLGAIPIAGLLAAALAGLIPTFHQHLAKFALRVNRALAGRERLTAVLLAFIVAIYLTAFALCSRDRLFLKLNDEHAYMIQAHMLARFRLWMAAYPPAVSPFFDALAMIVDRVYAPMYFPGTALALTPFVWLGLPFWAMTVTASALAAGLLYRVLAEMFDPLRGILAVMLLASLHTYRGSAILLLAEAPFLAAELLLIWSWMRFATRPAKRWAIVIGAAAGCAGITRPLDAVCFALPVMIAIIWQLRSNLRLLVNRAGLIAAGGAPFILLLAIQSIGVTGHVGELAEVYYNRENFPASPIGFHHVTPADIPPNLNPIKQQWLREWVIPSFQRHTPANAILSWYRGRLWQTLDNVLTNPILVLLLPLGFLSLRDSRRAVLIGAMILFLIGYAIYLFFLEHYVVVILPAVICLLFMGSEALTRAWPGGRVNAMLFIALVFIAASGLWPIAPMPPLPIPFAPDQRAAAAAIAALPPQQRAVVLFRFDPGVESFHDDPVYNDSVAWPDDAQVVRARDLGADENGRLVDYYAQRQPDRVFYVYDPDLRAAGQNPLIGPLGSVRELAIKGTIP
jgi:hypothetical protein